MAKATPNIPAPPTPPAAAPPVAPQVQAPPTPPTPPEPQDGAGASPPLAGASDATTTTPPVPPAPPVVEPDLPIPPAATPPDGDGDGEPGGSLPKNAKERGDAISRSGFDAGRKAGQLSTKHMRVDRPAKPEEWTDGEYERFLASYKRGLVQGDADKLTTEERLVRLEKAAGLPVPGAGLDE